MWQHIHMLRDGVCSNQCGFDDRDGAHPLEWPVASENTRLNLKRPSQETVGYPESFVED